MEPLPVACTLSEAEQQDRRAGVLRHLRGRIRHLEPLPTGYRFRFDATDAVLQDVFQLIELERTCCAFLRFDLTLEPGNGPIRLSLTGPEGTRAFLEDMLNLPPSS